MVLSCLNEYNGVLYPTYEQLPQTDVAQNESKKRNSGGVAISNCLHAYTVPNKAMFLSNDPIEGRVMLAMSLGLLVGMIQILFSLLHIGVFTKYLSDSIVNGFTIGAAFHVVVSQLYTLLGVKTNDLHTPFIIIGVTQFFSCKLFQNK
jgi:MFS superfamily sulfate permease-like transporter